jgi:hypothetical protein
VEGPYRPDAGVLTESYVRWNKELDVLRAQTVPIASVGPPTYIACMKSQGVALCLGAVLLFSTNAPGQERSTDSTRLEQIRLASPGMDSGGAQFLIPQHLQQHELFASPSFFFEGVPVPSSTPSSRLAFQPKPDLLAPLRAQWAREAEMSTFRTILGSLQLGGAAFLAARQLTGAGIMTARPRPVRSSRK